jgi:hypothetical protein
VAGVFVNKIKRQTFGISGSLLFCSFFGDVLEDDPAELIK